MNTIKSELRRFLRDRSGATVSVEFAFIVAPMVLMLMGTMEGSRMFWARNSLQYATEEAGRYAMTHVTETEAALETRAGDAFDAASYGTAVFDATLDSAPDPDTMTIAGSMTFNLDIVFLSFDIPLEGQSTVPLID